MIDDAVDTQVLGLVAHKSGDDDIANIGGYTTTGFILGPISTLFSVYADSATLNASRGML